MKIKTILIALGFLCSFLSSTVLHAEMQVTGIKVNIKSNSGLKARELAIAEARRQAFVQIIKSNKDSSYDLKTKGMPTDALLESAVDTFEIESEKISAKQYIGTLSITFNNHGLRRLLSGRYEDNTINDDKKDNSNKTDEKSIGNNKDVVLLPIYLTFDESLMWHSNSPWYNFWESSHQDDVLKTIVPLGDVRDIMSVSIEDIMTGRYQRVQNLMERYHKNALVVAIAKQVSEDRNELELVVKLFHKERLVFSSEPLLIEGDTMEDAFIKARIELIKALQNQGASVIKTKDNSLQTYNMTANFNSFAQWQQIRRGLKTGGIQGLKVNNLSRTHAKIRIQSRLSFNVLVSELSRKGLVLTEGSTGNFNVHAVPSKPNISKSHFAPQVQRNNTQQTKQSVLGPKIRNAFERRP